MEACLPPYRSDAPYSSLSSVWVCIHYQDSSGRFVVFTLFLIASLNYDDLLVDYGHLLVATFPYVACDDGSGMTM